MGGHQHPNKALAVGTAKHHQNKHGDLYDLWPGCPKRGVLEDRLVLPGPLHLSLPCWPLTPTLVTLEAQHSLACHRPDALLSHVLHKTYMVLWGQPYLKAWKDLLGQLPFLGGRQRQAPPWSRCLEQGRPATRQERTVALQHVAAAGPPRQHHHLPPARCRMLGMDQDGLGVQTQGRAEILSKAVSSKGLAASP